MEWRLPRLDAGRVVGLDRRAVSRDVPMMTEVFRATHDDLTTGGGDWVAALGTANDGSIAPVSIN